MGFLSSLFKDQRTAYAPLPLMEFDDEAAKIAAFYDAIREMGGNAYVAADTGSMRPTLDGGDSILCLPVPYEDLKEGDIVNYRPKWNNGKLTIHRLVLKDKGGWIASGDGNKRSENWERVTKDNYVDRATQIYRTKKKKADK